MTLGSGSRLGEMLSYYVGGEARPGGEVAGIDYLCPGAGYRAGAGPMQISDKITKGGHCVGTIDERSSIGLLGEGVPPRRGICQSPLAVLRWPMMLVEPFLVSST
jgi:hypothetical protein